MILPNLIAKDPDGALQLAARFTSLIRTGRSYSVRHASFRTQLENWHALLAPTLGSGASVRFESHDGDLFLNAERVPYRANVQRLIEQLAMEIAARTLGGVEFGPGLTVDELETFMTLFIAGERWKGDSLIAECGRAGLRNARPFLEARAKQDSGVFVLTPGQIGGARGAWMVFLGSIRRLLSGDAFDRGVELRHLKRAAQPVVDAVLAGDAVTSMLGAIAPDESNWAHAAHTALLAVMIGARLGLSRRDLADVAVAALLHDVGQDVGHALADDDRPHTERGARRIAWATTLNRSSLDAMRAALEHHDALAEAGPEAEGGGPSLLSQVVAAADAYVTFLSSAQAPPRTLWPSVALARVLDQLPGHQAAISSALVRALGCHPPGQMVELDDGWIARVVMPGPADPERPWVQLVADRRGRLLPGFPEIATLRPGRSIVRALPREDWPFDDAA